MESGEFDYGIWVAESEGKRRNKSALFLPCFFQKKLQALPGVATGFVSILCASHRVSIRGGGEGLMWVVALFILAQTKGYERKKSCWIFNSKIIFRAWRWGSRIRNDRIKTIGVVESGFVGVVSILVHIL